MVEQCSQRAEESGPFSDISAGNSRRTFLGGPMKIARTWAIYAGVPLALIAMVFGLVVYNRPKNHDRMAIAQIATLKSGGGMDALTREELTGIRKDVQSLTLKQELIDIKKDVQSLLKAWAEEKAATQAAEQRQDEARKLHFKNFVVAQNEHNKKSEEALQKQLHEVAASFEAKEKATQIKFDELRLELLAKLSPTVGKLELPLLEVTSHFGEKFFSQFLNWREEHPAPEKELVSAIRVLHEANIGKAAFTGDPIVEPADEVAKDGKSKNWRLGFERKEWRTFAQAFSAPKRQPAGVVAISIFRTGAIVLWSRARL